MDNESNFIKTFKTFSVTDLKSTSVEVIQEEYCPEEGCPDEEKATFKIVHDILTLEQENMDDLTQVEYDLPAHERCAAHTMNLVASSDITKSLLSSPTHLFAECSALWNKAGRSTQALDNVKTIFKRKLIVRTAIW